MSLLEVQTIYGGYGGVDILSGIDLRVEDGELVVIEDVVDLEIHKGALQVLAPAQGAS